MGRGKSLARSVAYGTLAITAVYSGKRMWDHFNIEPRPLVEVDYQLPSRNDQINKLQDPEAKFNVLIIGGGATGTGIALDAATRGLSVALVERDDFAAGKIFYLFGSEKTEKFIG